mmetsp:Transcript_45669/g.85312  ORF Transcript_45669/g.85312 Transcript_45669/m.85312 type:complete len:202 (+) Transcript_45669:112-717(+)
MKLLSQIGEYDRKITASLYYSVAPVIPRPFLKALEWAGDGTFWVPLPAILWMYPSVVPASHRHFLMHLFFGFLLDLLVIGSIKMLVHRRRPKYNKDDMHLVVSVDKYSFPSGHTSRCVFIASFALVVLNEEWHETFFICIWATMTAMSRVALGRHYIGDVLAGTCVGVALTGVLTKGTFHANQLWLPPVGHYFHKVIHMHA